MVFIVLYALVICIHLFACYTQKTTLRAFTKPLLMPLLILCAFLENQSVLPALLLLSLLFGWFGDVALLFSKKIWSLPLGILFFSIGHILYIPQLLSGSVLPNFFPTVLLIFIVVILLSYQLVKKILSHFEGIIQKCIFVYMLIILAMMIAALCQFFGRIALDTTLCALGSLFFVISDSTLATELYGGSSSKKSFIVMSTYIAAQTLLTIGLLLTS